MRYIEKKLEKSCPPDTLGCPDILLLQCEELAVIDNLSGKLYLIVYADPAQPEAYSQCQEAACAISRRQLKYSVRAPVVKPTPDLPGRARISPRPSTWRRWSAPSELIAGRRLHAGAGGPAHQEALHRVAAVACTARCARSIPVALHVLLPLR